MCGIVGYLDRKNDGEGCIGEAILVMLQALECRGPDSAGVALFGKPRDHRFVVRVKLGGQESARLSQVADTVTTTGSYARLLVEDSSDPKKFTAHIEALDPEFEVVSVGRELEIVKQVGSPGNLEATYGISRMRGSHGIGHTRLSTESRVDLSHSQPFWAHGYPDLAIVHNGHITNYHQLRRRYQQRGVKFYTENDSEIIAIYLGERLSEDHDLEKALRAMLRDLDGSYSCVVGTATELAFVKDPYALKPMLVAETDEFVALANEEVAIRARFAGDYRVREADVKEVRVWRN
jgi:glutamate synthase domain-containing protein 1